VASAQAAANDMLYSKAHPALQKTRQKISALFQLIRNNGSPEEIRTLSKSLSRSLNTLVTDSTTIFHKKALDSKDQTRFRRIQKKLRDESLSQEVKLSLLSSALKRIDTYCDAEEGLLTQLPRKVLSSLTEADSSSTGEGTLGQFLGGASGVLRSLVSQGNQAALSFFSSALIQGLEIAQEKMGSDPKLASSQKKIEELIATVKTSSSQESWGTLAASLRQGYQTLSSIKVYINGFHIPELGKSSRTETSKQLPFVDNIATVRKALGEECSTTQEQSKDWKALALAEKDLFIEQTTQYFSLQHVYEKLCGLPDPGKDFYLTLMQSSRPKENLKQLFFEELEKHSISTFKRLCAHLYFFLFDTVGKFLIKKLSNNYMEICFSFVDYEKKDQFVSLKHQITTNATRYLTILNGAYDRVTQNTHPNDTIQQMVHKEMRIPSANCGFPIKKLYQEFGADIITQATGFSIFGYFLKFLFGKNMVQNLLNSTVSSIKDDMGFTHALNCVVCDQLEEIWASLHEDKDSSSKTPPLSDERKPELNTLIKTLFTVLRKSKCQTIDELKEQLKSSSGIANLPAAFDTLFMGDVINNMSQLLDIIINSLVSEDQLQKLIYKFSSLANRSYEPNQHYSIKEMKEKEERIQVLLDSILNFTIDDAVNTSLDFSSEVHQQTTNRHVDELLSRVDQLINS
jgi:hypothetical protein